MTVRTPRRLLPLAAALLAAACGSASPPSSSLTTAAASRTSDSSPAQTVRHASSALSRRASEVRFREAARLHLTGGARSARTRALEAQLRDAALTETGVVHFMSIRQFQVLTAFVHGGFSFVSPRAHHVADRGPRVVNRAAVEEHTASFSPGAAAARFGPLVQLSPHTSIAGGTTTLDIDRATGLPRHISDVVSLTTNLAAVRPGLTGRLITTATSTRTCRFDPRR